MSLLTEGQYQELKQEFGEFFEVGMGAEDILDVLKEIDLEKLRHELVDEIR